MRVMAKIEAKATMMRCSPKIERRESRSETPADFYQEMYVHRHIIGIGE